MPMSSDIPSFWPQELNASYRPEQLIARGGFAVVIRARDLRQDRTVAVKLLLPDHMQDAVVRQRFLQEAELISKLDHAHILPLLEYGANAESAWMVLPYVSGASLRTKLESKPLPWREAMKLARDVASALSAIHARSIVHRDLKPENVLIDDSRALLTDFGISKPKRSGLNTGAGVILGTPGYIAPEMVSDKPCVAASDLFSLGVVMWEMLAGFRPHQRKDPKDPASVRTRLDELVASRETTAARVGDQVADVPRSLEGLIARLLEKNPPDRPTADQVVEELTWIETSPAGLDTPRDFASTIRTSRPDKYKNADPTPPAPVAKRKQWSPAVMAIGVILTLNAVFVAYLVLR
jgi:serine/threonine protein kinase